jgi:predicted AAA+ superfamily ATPase
LLTMWYERHISNKILEAAAHFPAVVVTGARQTGKTTLLKRLFPDHHYVSLDIPSRAAQAEESPDLFLKNHPAPIIVDEVQYAPKLFRHLKVAIDEKRSLKGQFILTGSQKFTLMREVSDSLAGRCAVFDFETLSVAEITKPHPSKFDSASAIEIIVRGGFPELWFDKNIDHVKFYESYLATYLERDVRQLINIVSLRDFERFIRACAARSGQLLDKASLARDVGISSTTCNDWISVLQASNQISLLEPWFGNFTKRLVKSPKLYMCDTGMMCFLLNLSRSSVSESPFIGAIWETLVYAELRKNCSVSPNPHSIWMYRDAQQLEIDFFVQTEGKTYAIECKWSEVPTLNDLSVVSELNAYLIKKPSKSLQKIQGLLVCRTPEVHPFANGMRAIPVTDIAKLIC